MTANDNHRESAILVGYNSAGAIVFDETISIHAYYDASHSWDDTENVKSMGLTRLTGKLIDSGGKVLQEFESAFSADTGEYIGGKAIHDDGTRTQDGIYGN